MMRAVSALTEPYNVPTLASLNAIMVDGTGMCGGCRVTVGGKTVYACVDGPEFDAHQVDFRELADRLTTYRTFEEAARERQQQIHVRKMAELAATAPEAEVGADTPKAAAPGGVPMSEPLEPTVPSARAGAGHHRRRPALPFPRTSPGTPRPHRPRTERMAIERVGMPERPAEIRARDFAEVNLGFTETLAYLEADRCLQCKNPTCMDGCPVRVDIPRFIKLLQDGDVQSAAASMLTDNALPCVTGRVCPQEIQCEGRCVRAKKGPAVAIGALERFVADWANTHEGAIVLDAATRHGQEGRDRRLRPGRPHRRRRARRRSATTSRSSRRSTPPAASSSTGSPSSAFPRTSSSRRWTGSSRAARRSR